MASIFLVLQYFNCILVEHWFIIGDQYCKFVIMNWRNMGRILLINICIDNEPGLFQLWTYISTRFFPFSLKKFITTPGWCAATILYQSLLLTRHKQWTKLCKSSYLVQLNYALLKKKAYSTPLIQCRMPLVPPLFFDTFDHERSVYKAGGTQKGKTPSRSSYALFLSFSISRL